MILIYLLVILLIVVASGTTSSNITHYSTRTVGIEVHVFLFISLFDEQQQYNWIETIYIYIFKPILKSHIKDKETMVFLRRMIF